MNLSLRDISGGLLLVPPFTFAVVTRKANRPRFISTTPQENGRQLLGYLQHFTATSYPNAKFGQFGAERLV
jgi:D-tyrosyl-tRNA(Tyr) deacylase